MPFAISFFSLFLPTLLLFAQLFNLFLVKLGPIHCGFQAKGHGVQGWAQRVGCSFCIHKELAVTLLCQQRCDNGRCVGRQSGVGGDGKVAGCKHPGSKVTGGCCCSVEIAHHGPRLPMANHPNDERIDASSKQCHGSAGS